MDILYENLPTLTFARTGQADPTPTNRLFVAYPLNYIMKICLEIMIPTLKYLSKKLQNLEMALVDFSSNWRP